MTDIVVPCFRAGLESGELCIWVTPDFLTTDEALEALKSGVPDFSDYLARKQIEVFPYTDWYLSGAPDDVQRATDSGFQRHLAKPPSVQALQELLAARGSPAASAKISAP